MDAHRLLSKSLSRLLGPPAFLLGRVLRSASSVLRRPVQAFDRAVEELLCELGVKLPSRDAALDSRPVGLYNSLGELIGRFAYPLLPLLIHEAQLPLLFFVNNILS